jgi:hypothetical protein
MPRQRPFVPSWKNRCTPPSPNNPICPRRDGFATSLHFLELSGSDERRPHRMVNVDLEEGGDAAHFSIEARKQIVEVHR